MKLLLVSLLFVAVTQAVDLTKIRPKIQYVTPIGTPRGEERIIGGAITTPGQFPHQAGLFMDATYFCGGSVISDTIILTAAHCAENTGSFEVHLGAQNINNNNEPNHQVVNTREYVVHAMWNAQTIDNDIAFVRLNFPVTGPGIAAIRLPSRSQQSETFAGAAAIVSGWGAISDIDTGISSELKYANVTVITNTECFNVYGSTINDNKICVDTAGGTSGTCFGDSGGPLSITEADGLLTQIGITSFVASAGCESGFPDGFTRVTYYLDWIEYNTGIPIRP